MEDLGKVYSNHMPFHHKIECTKMGNDRRPIKVAGYKVIRSSFRKTCSETPTKTNYGFHYDVKNR